MQEPPHMCQVKGYPIVLDMPSQFGTEGVPQDGQPYRILYTACPLLHPCKLGPSAFPAGFHFGHRRALTRPAPIEDEAQKLAGSLRLVAPGRLGGEGHEPCLFLMEA